MATRDIRFMETTDAIILQEKELSNALIATPVSQFQAKPHVNDLYIAVKTKRGKKAQPTSISAFPPDFILQFPNQQIRDEVLSCKTIEAPGFAFQLLPWTNTYRSIQVQWETKVTVDITGIPPHAFNKDCLEPLLHPHCDLQTYAFDKQTGVCTVNAYAHSVATIPSACCLGLSYEPGTPLQTFPINLHAQPYVPPQASTDDYWVPDPSKGTDLSNPSEDLDPELLEDPEVVAEAFAEQVRLEKLHEAMLSGLPINSNAFSDYSSDGTYDPSDYDYGTVVL